MSKKFKKSFWLLLGLCLLSGFRTLRYANNWNINATSTTASKIFVDYPTPTRAINNDITGGDSLAAIGATVTVKQVMDSIFIDYNSIQGAFVTLADTNDADFAANSTDRKITIKIGDPGVPGAGGAAAPDIRGTQMVGCTIYIKDTGLDKAAGFTGTVTHEIGHCLGLGHAQDSVNSVMSYFREKTNVIRLQIDDKMGLVYLYPTDSSKGAEDHTLGLSCARR